jgi:hypothetical protein
VKFEPRITANTRAATSQSQKADGVSFLHAIVNSETTRQRIAKQTAAISEYWQGE